MRYAKTQKDVQGIIIPVILLAGIGVLMVFSSSVFISRAKDGTSFYYLVKHFFNLAIGCGIFIILSRIDYRKFRIFVKPLLVLSFILLILVFIPNIGASAGEGSEVRRWINLRLLMFQPSELVKISIVFFLADYITTYSHRMKELRYGVAIPLAVMAFFQVIILLQPDFGAVMSIGVLVLTLLFIGGIKWRYALGIVGVALPVVVLLIFSAPYRLVRLLCFLNPWEKAQECGYQLVQSFLAFGRGGLTGVGFGDSKQKLFFLPEAHNDFIFSLIGEEAGLLGAVIVLGIFLYLLVKLFQVAILTHDSFGYYLAFGLTVMIISQALINFAVTIGLMPTKGLPLPFISYGGSALVINMAAVGILVNIARRQEEVPSERTPALSDRRSKTRLSGQGVRRENRRRYL
jgi:cell division protein FtsW